jgi:hypothetical protein
MNDRLRSSTLSSDDRDSMSPHAVATPDADTRKLELVHIVEKLKVGRLAHRSDPVDLRCAAQTFADRSLPTDPEACRMGAGRCERTRKVWSVG